MRIIYSLVVTMFCLASLSGQKLKFKKVSDKEMSSMECSYDKEAHAEYLQHLVEIKYKYNDTENRFEIEYTVHDRIKIYDKEGFKYADRSISYYTGDGTLHDSEITDLQGYTFNLVGGKQEKVKLNKANIFDKKKSKFYNQTSFAMPAVKEGSVLDIKYKVLVPRVYAVDMFYFQSDIPIRFSEFYAEVPEFYTYNFNFNGLLEIEKEEKERNEVMDYTYLDMQPMTAGVKTKATMEYLLKIHKFSAENVPAIKSAPFVYNMRNYMSSLRMELLYTEFDGSTRKTYTKTWNNIAKRLNESSSFGKQLNREYKELEPIISSVSSLSGIEKMNAIYHKIQSKYQWNGSCSTITNKGIKKMFSNGVGNIAEINLLLVNALQRSGFEAFPVVSKTKRTGFLNVSYPTLSELNYVMALVLFEDKQYFLDASDKKLSVNMIPSRALNLKAIILKDEMAIEIKMPQLNSVKETTMHTLSIDGNDLKGSLTQSLSSYSAYRMKKMGEKSYFEGLEDDYTIIENKKAEGLSELDSRIKISADISVKDRVKEIEGKKVIDLVLNPDSYKNQFNEETRGFSLFYLAKKSSTEITVLTIPEGYKVESLPEDLNLASPDQMIVFILNIKEKDHKVTVTIREKVKQSIIPPEYYESIKELYSQVEAKVKEKIVLVKID